MPDTGQCTRNESPQPQKKELAVSGNQCSSSVTFVKTPAPQSLGSGPGKAPRGNAEPAGAASEAPTQRPQHTAQAKTTSLTPGHLAPPGVASTESRRNERHKLPHRTHRMRELHALMTDMI